MLKKQLIQGVNDYKKTYGVDLNDKSFPKLSGKVTAELSKVSSDIKAEYELKEKVVSAIEDGRYDEAYKLLGIEVESADEADDVAVIPDIKVEEHEADIELDLGIEDDEATDDGFIGGVDLSVDDDELKDDSDDVNVDFGVMVDETEEEEKPHIEGQGALDAVMTVEDDDDDISIPSLGDEDFGFGDILSGTKFQK